MFPAIHNKTAGWFFQLPLPLQAENVYSSRQSACRFHTQDHLRKPGSQMTDSRPEAVRETRNIIPIKIAILLTERKRQSLSYFSLIYLSPYNRNQILKFSRFPEYHQENTIKHHTDDHKHHKKCQYRNFLHYNP